MQKLQLANALAPVPLARVASGHPVHAAPAAPATPAAVVWASPSATAPAVVTVKAERLKYARKKHLFFFSSPSWSGGSGQVVQRYASVAAVSD